MLSGPQLYQSKPYFPTSRWQLKKLLFTHLTIVFLLFTLFFPPTKALWRGLDTAFFNLINPTLDGPKWWQTIWALASHKWADWFEDVCILAFFIAFIKAGSRFVRMRRVSELIICTLYSAAIIYFFNRILLRHHTHFYWPSPSALFDHAVHLSQKVPWLHFKDSSLKSLPGDHATTALLFATFYGYLARGRLALYSSLYGAFLCLPRLITGAHWLSDILVGTTCIVLFFLSFLFFTPLLHLLSSSLESGLIFITSLLKKWRHRHDT